MAIIIGFFLLSFSVNASVLDFQQTIELITQQDPQFLAQSEKLQAQETQSLSSSLSLLPTISASYTREKSYNTEATGYGSSLLFTANLFKGGKDYFYLRSQYRLLDSEEKTLSDKQLVAQQKAIELTVSYLLSQKKYQIVYDLLQVQEKSLGVAKKRYDRGIIPLQELEKAQVDVFNSEARLTNAKIEKETFQKQVQSYLGQNQLKTEWPFTKQLLSGKKTPIKNKNVLRTDIASLEAYVESLEKSYQSQYGSFVPQVDLSYRMTNAASESGYFNSRGVEDKVLALNFTWTLWNGYKDRAQLAYSRYLKEEAKYRLTDLKRNFGASIETKKLNYQTSLDSLSRRLKTLEISRKIYRQSVRRFQEGKLSVNDLELDQNRYLETEILAQEGEAQVHLALSQLCYEYGTSVFTCLQ